MDRIRSIVKKKSITDIVIAVFFCVALTIIFLYPIIGSHVRPVDYQDVSLGRFEVFSAQWLRTKEDGSQELVNLPGTITAHSGETVKFQTTLPNDLEDNIYLCLVSRRQDLKVYIEGELRLEYTTEGTRFWGNSSVFRYLFVPLKEEDSGKTIEINSTTVIGAYAGNFTPFYIGEQSAIWNRIFAEYGAEVIIGFVLLVIYIIVFILCIIGSIHYHKIVDMFYMSLMVIFAMLWVLFNSRLRQVYVPNATIGSDLAYIMVILIPMPLISYIDVMQKKRYHRIYRVLSVVVLINVFVQPIFQILNIGDLNDMFVVSAVIFSLVFAVAYALIIKDLVYCRDFSYLSVAIGILYVGILAVAQILFFIYKILYFNGLGVAVGAVLFSITAAYNSLVNFKKTENEQAEALAHSNAVSAFLANVSHEIRTPINAIMGMVELILRGNISDETREYAGDIQSAGKILQVIVNDILDEAKIRSGKMEIVPVDYSLTRMVNQLEAMFAVRAKEKGLELEIQIDDSLPDGYHGDDIRIRQILTNLISNSIKYTEAGGVRLDIGGKRNGSVVELTIAVSDTGIGIREADRQKLFSAFSRLDLYHNRNVEGTGLGLAITASLLNLMGSKLELKSLYGVGSMFYFVLMQPVRDETTVAQVRGSARENGSSLEKRIRYSAPEAVALVVDDNKLNLKVLCKLLSLMGIQTDTAANGAEAVELAEKKKYDIMLIDHMMPVMDGIEALRRITKYGGINRLTRAVALTANVVGDAGSMYKEAGFDAFLAKPFVPEALEDIIFDLLPSDKLVKAEDTGEEEEIKDKNHEHRDLPDIPSINWKQATKNMPERELLNTIVRDFGNGAARDVAQVRAYYKDHLDERSAKSRNELRVKVHAMKNSAALIGATELSEEAKVLENAIKSFDKRAFEEGFEDFCNHYMSTAAALAEAFGEGAGLTSSGEADSETLKGLFVQLENAMESMDIDTFNEVMERLETYEYSDEMYARIRRLDESVLSLDKDMMTQTLATLREMLV